ncbi:MULTISPECIES: gamma-glutamyltransferase family protein [unclassified Polaromonas]|uniref:gamma-glutamyltransferase family protein n=1 Tax=unclassified Polaromonas TaxID=2638319 RepID=UPI0018CA2907|nr:MULTISPECIES: gamma-glutamyltransferase [unclassified Polaromonas]MBG6073774.1 gamma-glutamyltranspeptidase/glutathione hydrolase [Polaromonas sp. CG_9.7]MBG6115782.1 gamma-glutamyltranspeptidase/glutathione hydrolase [Polaromonas sp. CG_9.2]MDH6186679.1 gamma-glutamyltranspeptidase/glutathione hydrolase [Polaromonas sp. CG_23.6]
MSSFTTRPEITGTFGVVASTHWLASQTAMGVLERGGNAFDAAVAGGFVLQVVEPHLNGPGGEAPILMWSERERRMLSICGQGPAPAAATAPAFRGLGMEQVPGIGLLPATVPGAFAAWLVMLRDHGTWSLAEVLAPALAYARDGFPLIPRAVQAILAVQDLFRQQWISSAEVWLPGGHVPAPGALFRLPALAATYERIIRTAEGLAQTRSAVIDAAIQTWYQGFVAKEIDHYYRTEKVEDGTGERHAGLLRFEDLERWTPAVEVPLTLDFGQYTLAKCGFWSQGPAFLQQVGMLRHAGLEQHAPESAGFVHRIAEAAKLALADRLAWYGAAPGASRADQLALLSDDYLRQRWQGVCERAAQQLQPGAPGGHLPRLPDLDVGRRTLLTADTRFGIGEPTFAALPPVSEWLERELFVGDTCHIDVIDRHGNMVAATPSGGWLSSSPAIPALGFSINTRLQMTWLDDGLPNTVTPGVPPCTTLSPSLALRDGEPYMVFGTPGGDQQDQWSSAFFLRHAVHGMNLQEAIDAPAWHVDHFPSSFWPRQTILNRLSIESRFGPAVINELRAAGHNVRVGDPWSEGRMSACSRDRDPQGRLVLRAAANPRGMQGYAVGR